MRERLIGTDGIRGEANRGLTATLAMLLGKAAGVWIRQHPAEVGNVKRPFVVVGRDTRLSGDMLEAALASGLAAMGVDVRLVGVIPTPGVSQIVLSRGAAAGVVISASHNPFGDNGIKFFGRNGKKLADSVEDEITALLQTIEQAPRPTGGNIGRIYFVAEWGYDYAGRVREAVHTFGERPLEGLHLVMDCANGAAYHCAPDIFSALGAKITLLSADPDGVNINRDCGSTKTASMRAKVKELGASAGVAFDGDADRVMLADSEGHEINGDRMMAIIALHLKRQGKLTANSVVATIMSNVGLEKALDAEGVRLIRTKVGDRYVAEAMEKEGAIVGGEQSGHILLPHVTPTGDGMVTALQVLAVMHETGKSLSELASVVQDYPQRLVSFRVKNLQGWDKDPEIQAAIRAAEARFENPIWLSVRASGTEPLLRVMAQGTDKVVVEEVVEGLCTLLKSKLGEG